MSVLNQLPSITDKAKKRIGRGYGSGKGGHTSSRGQKGQKSRVGATIPLWFEGGQLPLVKRMPMTRGKGKLKMVSPTAEISIRDLNKLKAEIVTLETLKLEKVIDKRFKKAKVIAGGELTKKVILQGIKATPAAQAAIEAKGGQVT